jgi:hypothetical protein
MGIFEMPFCLARKPVTLSAADGNNTNNSSGS